MNTSNLKRLYHHLQNSDYNVIVQQENKLTPVPQLIVELGKDIKQRDVVMHITEQASSGKGNGKREDSLDIVTLRFFVLFPFQIDEESIPDLARYLFRINSNCELGNLILRDKERLVVYQYSHLSIGKDIETTVVDIVIAMVKLLLETFENAIEMLASGAQTLQQLEAEAYEILRGSEFKDMSLGSEM